MYIYIYYVYVDPTFMVAVEKMRSRSRLGGIYVAMNRDCWRKSNVEKWFVKGGSK